MFDNDTINNTLTSTISSLPIANLTAEETSPMVFMIRKLWYQMFLSTLISSLLMHSIGAVILYVRLRTHVKIEVQRDDETGLEDWLEALIEEFSAHDRRPFQGLV